MVKRANKKDMPQSFIQSKTALILTSIIAITMGASVLRHTEQNLIPSAQEASSFFDDDDDDDAQTLVQTETKTRSQLPYPQFDAELTGTVADKPRVIRTYPHDPDAFTQGLFIHDGVMYESTGLYGHSTVRKVDVSTGKVQMMSKFSNEIFGEGITMHSDGKIYGLSWLEGKGFRINPSNLEVEKVFQLPVSEGWGITSDGKNLIVTDSSQTLTFLDTSFKPVKKVVMRDPKTGKDVPYVNELEYIDGKIYGNVYGLDYIVVVDPASGQVERWIDCRGLWKGGYRAANNVFNGIAYDKEHKKLFVTGKNWSKLYEIEI